MAVSEIVVGELADAALGALVFALEPIHLPCVDQYLDAFATDLAKEDAKHGAT